MTKTKKFRIVPLHHTSVNQISNNLEHIRHEQDKFKVRFQKTAISMQINREAIKIYLQAHRTKIPKKNVACSKKCRTEICQKQYLLYQVLNQSRHETRTEAQCKTQIKNKPNFPRNSKLICQSLTFIQKINQNIYKNTKTTQKPVSKSIHPTNSNQTKNWVLPKTTFPA